MWESWEVKEGVEPPASLITVDDHVALTMQSFLRGEFVLRIPHDEAHCIGMVRPIFSDGSDKFDLLKHELMIRLDPTEPAQLEFLRSLPSALPRKARKHFARCYRWHAGAKTWIHRDHLGEQNWLGDDGPPSALQNLVHRASLGFGAHGVSADARAAMLELAQQGSLRAIDEGQTDEDTPSSDESGEEGAQPVRRVESPSTLLREHSRAQIAEAAAKINPYQCCGEADDDGWVVIDAVRCALAAAVAWRARNALRR